MTLHVCFGMAQGPLRKKGFGYRGRCRYLLTICVAGRRPLLAENDVAPSLIAQFLRVSIEEGFAIHAYCVMADHAHFVVEGQLESADLCRLLHRWKTITSYWWKQTRGTTLWQRGFHDRIIEGDDALAAAVDYVLQDPVRDGVVDHPDQYPHSGPHPR